MSNFTDQFMNEADRRGSGDLVRSMLDSGMLMVIDASSGDTLGDASKAIPELKAGPRSLMKIARDIKGSPWYRSNSSIYARDYIEAMSCLNSINDTYGLDSAESVVRYALSNLSTWRGDQARAIKAELKDLLKAVK
jgi:hypothetical protein